MIYLLLASLSSENFRFFDLISTRHSVRSYKQKDLSKEIIAKILHAAQRAPSAGNLQSYQIYVVTKKEIKKRLAEAAHDQNYIIDSSVIFVFCADPQNSAKEYGIRGEQLFSIQDATIACTYAQIAAQDLGLASLWVGAFDEKMVDYILNVGNLRPIAMLVVGFTDEEEPEITDRRSIKEIIHEI